MKNIVITAANSLYFETLRTLVASLHKTSFTVVDEIVVYSLGLDVEEIKQVESWAKCKVENLITKFDVLPFDDYLLPKGHAYKCFCLVDIQESDTNILWLDAGVMALKNVKEIFDIIETDHIFCVGDEHLNKNFTKDSCIEIMQASESELEDTQLSSGIIGYKVNGKFDTLFQEAYNFSTIEGCVVGDEQNHRHDQSVYSILVSRHKAKKQDIDIYGYWTSSSRTLQTAIEKDAVIFVHRRGHYDNTGLIHKE